MVMFESTFNKAYYKELHRYVHGIYRREKGYLSLKKLLVNPMRLNFKDLRTGLATFYYIPTTFTRGLKLKKLKLAGPSVNL
jgi:anaerobic magnesium-protoporphyrin IX monomethyl ester cyclase